MEALNMQEYYNSNQENNVSGNNYSNAGTHDSSYPSGSGSGPSYSSFSGNSGGEPPKKRKTGLIILSSVLAGALTAVLVMVPVLSNWKNDVLSQLSGEPAPTAVSENASPEVQTLQLGSSSSPVISSDNPYIDIAAAVSPSVVAVINNQYVSTAFGNGSTLEEAGSGSGVILTADGYIVTNNHVIDDADAITVTLSDGQEYPATLVGKDATTDLAVIKVEATGLTPVAIGDSSSVQVGEFVVAIGNPLGNLTGTVTQGIVSAVNRELNVDGNTYNLIQTDAAINPGNSGGALVNSAGQLIGINSLKSITAGYDSYGNAIAADGIGFAIPVNEAMPIIEALIKDGKIARPALGISVYEITLEDATNWSVPRGLLIRDTELGSPAATAGVQANDIITAVDGQTITSTAELKEILQSKDVGGTVSLTLWRNNQTGTLEVSIGDSNEISQKAEELELQQQQQQLPFGNFSSPFGWGY
jgi:serine protease Do